MTLIKMSQVIKTVSCSDMSYIDTSYSDTRNHNTRFNDTIYSYTSNIGNSYIYSKLQKF